MADPAPRIDEGRVRLSDGAPHEQGRAAREFYTDVSIIYFDA